ncbi:MAG: V-type ATP synthase subunit C [Methanogenium sp.]
MSSVSTTGPAPYIYSSTRMRVRKSKLIRHDEYMRMLNMSLPEIIHAIQEMEYKAEIDELASSFCGLDLIEEALSWNLAKEFQNVLGIMPGAIKKFTASYQQHWDIYNVLTILRGKTQGVRAGKIKEVLIPAGSLDRVILDRLLAEDSPERIVEGLTSWSLYPILEREFSAAMEKGTFGDLENELFKAYYVYVLKQTASGVKGGKPFRDYLKLEIDLLNIKTVIRLYKGNVRTDVRNLMIGGGSISVDDLVRMAASESMEEILEEIKKRYPEGPIGEMMDSADKSMPLHEMENGLTRVMLDQMDRISMRYPFSICPTLVYLNRKRYEVANLRAIARGKESGLPGETIAKFLVV